MSGYSLCHQCGTEIEEKGIHFHGQVFCCDECCEAFDADLQDKGEPELEELKEVEVEEEDFDSDLGYQEKEGFEEDSDPLADDFDIKPEDF